MAESLDAYFIKDVNTYEKDEFFEHEYFAVELCKYDYCIPKNSMIEISSFFTSLPCIYKIQLLKGKSGYVVQKYSMIAFIEIILYPNKSFQISMSMDDNGYLITFIRGNNDDFVYYYKPFTYNIVSVACDYPFTSSALRSYYNTLNNNLLSAQKHLIEELNAFLIKIVFWIEEYVEFTTIPEDFRCIVNKFKLEQQPNESLPEYYGRLYNMAYCIYFNLHNFSWLNNEKLQDTFDGFNRFQTGIAVF